MSNFIEDFGGLSLLKNCVTVHSDDVVDSTDARTLAEKGKLRLRVLTQLSTFTHGAGDICFGQKLVRNILAGSQ